MITYDCFNYGKRCSQLVLMIICSLLFCETFSQTSWNWLKPLPTGNHIESVYFINQKIGYAAGILGTIIHTTDSGANWTLQNSNSSNNLYQIYFINKNYGFAVGKSGIILRTVNGGNYWERINSSNRCDLHDIIFVNKNTGYAAGLSGTILKTTTGGSSWTRILKGDASLFCINFLNEQYGIAAGYKIILQTSDGGISWKKVDTGILSLETVTRIFYADANTIYAVSNSPEGIFLKSKDDGISWEAISLGLTYLFEGSVDLVKDMSFMNADTGFIVTCYGTILKTFNSGNSWEKDSTFRSSSDEIFVMSGVNTVEKNFINICGGGGTIISSTDCGSNWFVQKGNEKTIRDCCVADSNVNYCSGEDGIILKSINAGMNWIQLKNFTNKTLNAIFFLNQSTGFVAGNKGVIFKTSNGGSNWTNQTGYTNLNLNSIYFLNNDTGLVTGGTPDNGRAFIFRTTNGGTNWYEVYDSMSMGVFNSIKFVNRATGFIVGDNGNILLTANAGSDWISSNITSLNFNSIDFIDSLNGIICGDDGIVFITGDGGLTWNYSFSQTNKRLNSIKYFDRNNIAAAGDNGDIVITSDGGLNWTRAINLTANNLHSICFLNKKTFAFGDYGTVLFSGKSGFAEFINSKSLQKKVLLNQNFPNPFNPVTVLEFGISDWEFVSVKVYNLLGKEIATLVNDKKAPGRYKVTFDARLHGQGSILPSGIYFYTLITDGISQTRKMLLIK